MSCASDGDGAHLLLIDSDEERQDLVRALADVLDFVDVPGGESVWIGLHEQNGDWVWDDDNPRPNVHIWGEGQPAAGATGRAQLLLTPKYDSGLAYANGPPKSMFICEK